MNRRSVLKSGAFGAAAAAAAPLVFAAPKDLEALSTHWAAAKAFTLKVADAMPADDYAFKPKPDMRGFGELMAHIGEGNMYYLGKFNAGPPPASLKAPKQFDKDSVRNYLNESFDYCAGVLSKLTNEDLDKSFPGHGKQPGGIGWDWILNAVIHTAHHRGYAEVYLHEKNIAPPPYSV